MDLDNLQPRSDNHEAAMARADLYKLANYSMKLFKMIQEGQELEGWVQAKITKAADYIASVYHFMEYEMKVSEYGETLENAEMYSESVRRAFAQKLYEAKCKMKEMSKKNQKDLAVKEAKDDDPAEPDPEAIAKKKAREAAQRRREEKEEADKDDLSKDYKPKTAAKSGTTKVAGKAYGGANQKADSVDESTDGYEDYRKRKTADRLARGISPDEATKFDRTTMTKKGTFSKKVDRYDPETGKLVKQNVGRKAVGEASKPDFLDVDKDGNKKEPMKKAVKDKKIKEAYGRRSSYYDHTDQERREQDAMDWDKRDFKRREMEHELGHEDGKPFKKSGKKVKEAAEEKRAPAKKTERETTLPSGAKVKTTKVQGWQSQKADKAADKEKGLDEAKKSKPDFLDMDKDGDKKETMKKAVADKKKSAVTESANLDTILKLAGRKSLAE